MKRSDLVGIDNLGNITVIELKRDIAGPMTEFQAIQYASYYSDTRYDKACEIYAKYLSENKDEFKIDDDTDFRKVAQEEIRNFCDQTKIPDNFKKIMITTGDRSKKMEIRFSRAKKEDLEGLLKDLGITFLAVKEKSDIESHGLANPTPAIDYKEEFGNFDDVITFCKAWLEVT